MFYKLNEYGVVEIQDLENETITKNSVKNNSIFITFPNVDVSQTALFTFRRADDIVIQDLVGTYTKRLYNGTEYYGFKYVFSSKAITQVAGTLNCVVRVLKDEIELLTTNLTLNVVDNASVKDVATTITDAQYLALNKSLTDTQIDVANLGKELSTKKITHPEGTDLEIGNPNGNDFIQFKEKANFKEIDLNGKDINLIFASLDKVGLNENLSTKDKATLVNAINEVLASLNAHNVSSSAHQDIRNQINDTLVESEGYTDTSISKHDHSETSHPDIRTLINDLTDKVNALANSDDQTLDDLKEIVDYIKDNRELIEEITSTRVAYTDIVDNLDATATDKVLSANQGRVLNDKIDAIPQIEIVDDLVTFDSTKALSANQGAELNRKIINNCVKCEIVKPSYNENEYYLDISKDLNGVEDYRFEGNVRATQLYENDKPLFEKYTFARPNGTDLLYNKNTGKINDAYLPTSLNEDYITVKKVVYTPQIEAPKGEKLTIGSTDTENDINVVNNLYFCAYSNGGYNDLGKIEIDKELQKTYLNFSQVDTDELHAGKIYEDNVELSLKYSTIDYMKSYVAEQIGLALEGDY